MTDTLFMMPIKQGKTEMFKQFLLECLGPKQKDYADMLKRYHLNTLQSWINTANNVDYALFIHDMDDDAAKLLEGWSTSTHPFDQWFDRKLREYYDFAGLENAPPQPVFVGEIDIRKL